MLKQYLNGTKKQLVHGMECKGDDVMNPIELGKAIAEDGIAIKFDNSK